MILTPQQQNFGLDLCRALELDPKDVRAIELRVCVDEVVTVTVERAVTVEQGKALLDVLTTWKVRLERDATTLADSARRFEAP